MKLLFKANGDFCCGNCMYEIYFEDTCLKEHRCPKCKKEYTIPEEAYFIYEDIVIKDNQVVEIDDLSLEEQMQVFLAKRGCEKVDTLPLINLNHIRTIR